MSGIRRLQGRASDRSWSPGDQVNFVGGLRWRYIAEATEDPALRIELAKTTIPDQHCRGMAGGHREAKTVRRNAIMHEVVKTPQQHAGPRLALELM